MPLYVSNMNCDLEYFSLNVHVNVSYQKRILAA
jgi:hypothetical protein